MPPLKGLRVLVGRARHQASALSSGLRDLGAKVQDIPFIEICQPRSYKSLDTALRTLSDYDWLILTSVNGVDALWSRLPKLQMSSKTLSHLKIAAIGPATRQAIEKHGLKVNVVPKEYVAESVVASLRRRVKGKRVLLARAKIARDVIPRELRKLGSECGCGRSLRNGRSPIFAQASAGGDVIGKDSSRHNHVHQFLDRQEFRGAVGKRPRAGAPAPHKTA